MGWSIESFFAVSDGQALCTGRGLIYLVLHLPWT